MINSFFDILSFEGKFNDFKVIVSSNNPDETRPLNSYNSVINYKNLFDLLQSLQLTKYELDYLENYYLNCQHMQGRFLGALIEVFNLLENKK